MRLLATGDWQAGVATVTLEDQEAVWHRIVDAAIEREVDAFLHGGDLVEGPVFTMEQLAAVRRVFARIRAAGIPLLIVKGNSRHDLSVRPVHALDVFRDYDGIHVCDTPTVAVLADKVAVCALPWVHPGRLIAQANGSLTHNEADLTTAEMLVRIARHLREQAARIQAGTFGPANLPTVLLAHWAISGSALPTGIPVDDMREPVLSWPDLDALGYDAIIGAHIHKPQQLTHPAMDDTLGIVVGSPQPLNHGEGGYEHGCWIVDIAQGASGNAVSTEFVPIASPRFITLDYDENGISLVGLEGAHVRVRFTATEDEARRIDHDSLRKELAAAGARSVSIKPEIIRQSRARSEEISEELSPGDALLAYCRAQGIPVEMAGRMLARLNEWSDA